MRSILLAFSLFAALIVPAKASSITYGVNFQGSAFSIAGTITTDGATGGLFDSDVTAYDLTVAVPGLVTYTIACGTACYASFYNCTFCGTPIGTAPFPSGFALFATQQYLLFNFEAAKSNYIILGQNTYPSYYVEFYDHLLIDSSGQFDDEGPGAVQVGGGTGILPSELILAWVISRNTLQMALSSLALPHHCRLPFLSSPPASAA